MRMLVLTEESVIYIETKTRSEGIETILFLYNLPELLH